jgi:hypothetical protein
VRTVSLPDESNRHNPALAVLVVRERTVVLGLSLLGAAALTLIFALIYWGQITAFEVAGFFMTAWALFVALLIYIAQTASPSVLAKDLQASKLTLRSQTLGTDADEDNAAARPDQKDLAAKIEQYGDWIKQLLREYPKLPIQDITYVDRAPGNARNPTVIVRTKRGRTYSVFHGGRNGDWYVSDLSEP